MLTYCVEPTTTGNVWVINTRKLRSVFYCCRYFIIICFYVIHLSCLLYWLNVPDVFCSNNLVFDMLDMSHRDKLPSRKLMVSVFVVISVMQCLFWMHFRCKHSVKRSICIHYGIYCILYRSTFVLSRVRCVICTGT